MSISINKLDNSLDTILSAIPPDGINLRKLYELTCDKVKSRDCWGVYYELLKRTEQVKEYNCPKYGISVRIK